MMRIARTRRRVPAVLALVVLFTGAAPGARAASWPLRIDAQGATPPPSQGTAGTAHSKSDAPASAPSTPVQEGLASIRGLLFQSDEATRIRGATVTAINTRTGRRYVSNYTGDNGAYEVKELPAGTYDIAIDSSDRIYVTDNLIDLAEKQRLYLSFSLQPKGSAAPGAGAPGAAPDRDQAKVTFTDPNAVPASTEPPKKKGFWHSAGGITIITVLVAGAVGAGIAAQQN